MGNLMTQSLKILRDATIETGKDYLDNATKLVDDAREIRTEVMRTGATNVDTLKNLKRSLNFKRIHDWFYQKEGDYADYDTEEYDPGFDTGSDDDENTSSVLNTEEMKSISRQQSSVMIQIGARQAETAMASTAEIVTTLNQRTAEVLASVNNLNKTLMGISSNLDKFTKVYQAEKEEETRQASLYDRNGRMSLSSIFNTAKNSSGGIVGGVKDAIGLGSTLTQGITPTDLVKMGFQMFLADRPLDVLGGRSIDQVMTKINEGIGEFSQQFFEGLITSKPFTKLFGDLRPRNGEVDWKSEVVNNYNDRQAIFNGYTQTTITKIIPEYLRLITRGVTGINYNIDSKGNLTQGTSVLDKNQQKAWDKDQTANQQQYANEMWGKTAKASLSSNISYTARKDILASMGDKNITATDVNVIISTLNGAYVQLLDSTADVQHLDPKTLREDTGLSEAAISMTARIMAASSNTNNVDWMIAVRTAWAAIISDAGTARRFCNNVNKAYKVVYDKRMEFATSGAKFSNLARTFTDNDFENFAKSKNAKTYKNQTTLAKLDEAQEKLNNMDKLSKAERIRRRSEIDELQRQIQEYEKELRKNGYGDNTYNQNTYGSTFNINKNGCGPVALADLLNRKGMYSPSNGMTAMDYMSAATALGVPLSPGKVTTQSLRNASPNNPITLLGSGVEFGTRQGSNHFVNVIDSDKHGNAYIMNPIDGKIHKRSANSVAGSSVIGLYGHGDVQMDDISVDQNDKPSIVSRIYGSVKDMVRNTNIGSKVSRVKNSKFVQGLGKVAKSTDMYEAGVELANETMGDIYAWANKRFDNSYNKSVDKMRELASTDKVSDEDRQIMEEVLSLMNAAVSDGDSGPDKQAIMAEISKIKNQKLQARLRGTVGGMLERNEAKNKQGGGIIGKIIGLGKGMLVKFFTPLISGIKGIISSVVKGAKKYFTPVMEFFKRNFVKNNLRITEGGKAVFEGAKDTAKGLVEWIGGTKTGQVVKEKGKSAVTRILEGVGKIAGTLMALKDLAVDFMKNTVKKIFKLASNSIVNLGSFIKKTFGLFEKRENNRLDQYNGDSERTGLSRLIPSKYGAAFATAGNAVRKAMSEYDMKKQEAATPGLAETRSTEQMISGEKNSILSKIFEFMENKLDPDKRKVENNTTIDTSVDTTPTTEESKPQETTIVQPGQQNVTPTTSTDDSSVGQTVQADSNIKANNSEADTNTRQTTSASATTGSSGSTQNSGKGRDKFFNGLFKMLGGGLSILKGIGGHLLNIFMGMSGVQLAMKTLTTLAKDILKPINSLVKTVVKSLKPILKTISGALKDVMKSVVSVIAPLLVSLQPVLESLGSLVTALLEPLTPLLKGVGFVLNKIVSLLAGPLETMVKLLTKVVKLGGWLVKGVTSLIGGLGKVLAAPMNLIKTFTKPLLKGLGKLFHPFSKKKRQKYYNDVGINDDDTSEGDPDEEKDESKKGHTAWKYVKNASVGAGVGAGAVLATVAAGVATGGVGPAVYAIGAGVGALVGVIGTAISNRKKKDEKDEKQHAKEREEDIKKHDQERSEDIKRSTAEFKYGTSEIVSNTKSSKDAMEFLKGVGKSGIGIIEQAGGGIVSGLGRVISAVGELASLLPFVSDENPIAMLGKSLLEKSDKIISDGEQMFADGIRLMKHADASSAISNSTKIFDLGATVETTSNSSTGVKVGNQTHIQMQSAMNGGDIPYSNADISVIAAGDSQTSYGDYLNMARRGCGPVALAEAYQRRTGRKVNARNVANAMTRNGTYDPSRGTSVRDYVNASNSMGMGTRLGGVTAASLKYASPNNPITLMGSGVEFGTRKGNNHYLNAIGTDKYGGVYVSNPMTGKVHRRSANSLAGSSVLGIYGSGDITEMASFSDDTNEAISNLLSFSNIFSNLFNGSEGGDDIESISTAKEKRDNDTKVVNSARGNYSDAEYEEKVLKGMELYKSANPIRDNETPEKYEKRISNGWNNTTTQNKYIAMAVQSTLNSDLAKKYDTLIENSSSYFEPYMEYKRDAAGNIIHDEAGNPIVSGGFKYLTESSDSDYVKAKQASLAVKRVGELLTSNVTGGSSNSGGYSSSGRRGNVSSFLEAAAMVWEAYTKKYPAGTYNYGDRGPVTLRNGDVLPELHPDCSGMVSGAMNYMGYTFKNTVNGSKRRWTTHDINNAHGKNTFILDPDGSLSSDWEFIPINQVDQLQEGDIINAVPHVGIWIKPGTGQVNAYGFDAGSTNGILQTGKVSGPAMLDGDPDWKSKLYWTMGPKYSQVNTIVRYVGGNATGVSNNNVGYTAMSQSLAASQQGKVQLSKAMQSADNFFGPHANELARSDFYNSAKRAGLTTAQTAMVAAIGIHEDGAKKLTGEKSLTRVTVDCNGQTAFGIMNWIPRAGNRYKDAEEKMYGSTLADQLPYISKTYFDPNSTFDRAKNVNFSQYSSALAQALGHNPQLGKNDRWGPFAEKDIAESMGHYVANALVPAGWNTTPQLAKHMRTAADAYNWMVANGKTMGGGVQTSSGVTIDTGSAFGIDTTNLPDYYQNLLNALGSSNAYSDYSYDDYSYDDYSYDDYSYDDSPAEGVTGNTQKYATNSERSSLYNQYLSFIKKNWDSPSKHQANKNIALHLTPDASSKITCTLTSGKTYKSYTTHGSWLFIYAGNSNEYGPLCGWAQSSEFHTDTKVTTINSQSDAAIAKWNGKDTSTRFFKIKNSITKDLRGNKVTSNHRKHWFTGAEYPNTDKTFNGRAWANLGTSYDKSLTNTNLAIAKSDLSSTTLGELFKTPGAAGDFDFNVMDDYSFYTPTFPTIPELDPSILNGDPSGSYTVNNYNIQGGINRDTADMSRQDMLTYLLNHEITTRSPYTDNLLQKILDKLDNVKVNNNQSLNQSASNNDVFDNKIPDVIRSLVR